MSVPLSIRMAMAGLILLAGALPLHSGDFFAIKSVKYLGSEPRDGCGVWHFKEQKPPKPPITEFQPCLETRIAVRENIRSDQVTARAYFFDRDNKPMASQARPSESGPKSNQWAQFEMPVLFFKEKPDRFFFEIPKSIRDKEWKAVVVFGDKNEAKSACYPATANDVLLSYPEKALVHDHSVKKVERKPTMDPLIEHVVKTRNPRMPQITLFLRPPKGISDPSEVSGVMAICILAGGLEAIKRELTKEEMSGDYDGLFSFANKNKLAILAWGAPQGMWDPNKNHKDLASAQAKAMDASFDTVADAWEKGVKELCGKYGLPDHDFLLWGMCGSAQWAHRLCLRKPDYFLAIDVHIPGSFDKPTPEASRVLWCLTTGELYGGYQRSLRFVEECRMLGYPMVYKAIVGLGHAGHPDATALGFKFFEFALTLKESRDAYDRKRADVFNKPAANVSGANRSAGAPPPWPEIFQHPPYYGDMVNQEIFPSDQVEMIPKGFRVPLPSKGIADVWGRGK